MAEYSGLLDYLGLGGNQPQEDYGREGGIGILDPATLRRMRMMTRPEARAQSAPNVPGPGRNTATGGPSIAPFPAPPPVMPRAQSAPNVPGPARVDAGGSSIGPGMQNVLGILAAGGPAAAAAGMPTPLPASPPAGQPQGPAGVPATPARGSLYMGQNDILPPDPNQQPAPGPSGYLPPRQPQLSPSGIGSDAARSPPVAAPVAPPGLYPSGSQPGASPVQTMMGAAVSGALGNSPLQPPQPPVKPPTPMQASAAQRAPQTDALLDRVMGFLNKNSNTFLGLAGGFGGAPSFGQGIGRAALGAMHGGTQDITQSGQNAMHDALIAKGASPAEAMAAIGDPKMAQALILKYFNQPHLGVYKKGIGGREYMGWINESNQTVNPLHNVAPGTTHRVGNDTYVRQPNGSWGKN
jgi:hypothetical protein